MRICVLLLWMSMQYPHPPRALCRSSSLAKAVERKSPKMHTHRRMPRRYTLTARRRETPGGVSTAGCHPTLHDAPYSPVPSLASTASLASTEQLILELLPCGSHRFRLLLSCSDHHLLQRLVRGGRVLLCCVLLSCRVVCCNL